MLGYTANRVRQSPSAAPNSIEGPSGFPGPSRSPDTREQDPVKRPQDAPIAPFKTLQDVAMNVEMHPSTELNVAQSRLRQPRIAPGKSNGVNRPTGVLRCRQSVAPGRAKTLLGRVGRSRVCPEERSSVCPAGAPEALLQPLESVPRFAKRALGTRHRHTQRSLTQCGLGGSVDLDDCPAFDESPAHIARDGCNRRQT
jgi:hypothetical protein